MSTSWRWQVEARSEGDRFSWKRLVDRLDRERAEDAADRYAARHPEWQIRLLDTTTGEVIHLA